MTDYFERLTQLLRRATKGRYHALHSVEKGKIGLAYHALYKLEDEDLRASIPNLHGTRFLASAGV